jgi:hypothetical protein
MPQVQNQHESGIAVAAAFATTTCCLRFVIYRLTPVSSLLGAWSTATGTVPLLFAIGGSSKGIVRDNNMSSSSEASTSADDTRKCLVESPLLVVTGTGMTYLHLRVGVGVGVVTRYYASLSSAAVTSSFIRFPLPSYAFLDPGYDQLPRWR